MSDESAGVLALRAALAEVDRAIAEKTLPRGPRNLAHMLVHCAQSLECAMDGFPVHRSWLVRRVLGPLAARRFLARGRMRHDVAAPIPGVAEPGHASVSAARARLSAAIERYVAASGAPAEHFAFGRLDRERAARLQALHIEDHLAAW
jgi:hypothetical protein